MTASATPEAGTNEAGDGARATTHRRPGPAMWKVVAVVTVAALQPIGVMAVGFTAVALLAGLAADALADTLAAALVGTVVCGLSLICHESAHLVAIRLLTGDRLAGAVENSRVNVWVVGPQLAFPAHNLIALAGPLAGMALCWLASAAGAASWICLLIGVVHAVNLLPLTPDGAAVWSVRRAAR
jgi:hypothetical protein